MRDARSVLARAVLFGFEFVVGVEVFEAVVFPCVVVETGLREVRVGDAVTHAVKVRRGGKADVERRVNVR